MSGSWRDAAGDLARRAAPRTVDGLRELPELRAEVDRLREEVAELRRLVHEHEGDLREARAANRRIAELTDVVVQRLAGPPQG